MQQTELQILLDLSSAIASVKNKDDLFLVIVEKINPVFNFPTEAIILTVDAEEKNYRLMFGESSILPKDEINFYKSRQFPVEEPLRNILHADKALKLETKPLIDANPERAGAQFMKKLGIKELISCRLQVSGKIIGCFSLHADKTGHFNDEHLPLFKSVAEIVAVAVSNILANEEAELKEHQKSQLLSISRHIANVRDKNDLFQLITKEFKTFIPFDIAVISVLNEDSNSFGIFLANADESFTRQELYKQATSAVFPIEEGSIPWLVVRSPHPLIVDIEQAHKARPDIPYTRNAYMLGMKEQMLTRLVHSGKVIGALSLVSTTHGTFTEREQQTLQSLSNLFAIALNNILANMEIEQREKQNAQLLNISTHIATIRDKKDLFRLIANDMKAFIDFDDVEIAIINEEKQSFSFFLSGEDGNGKNGIATGTTYPAHKDNPFFNEYFSRHHEPFINDLESAYTLYPHIESIKCVYELGMKEEIIARLSYSGKIIGVMSILSKSKNHFNYNDVVTARSLSNLVAIALNNILSNEELELREHHKSQLLNISAHIATIRDKKDLFHLVADEVKSFISFDDLFIATVDEEKQTFSVFLSDAGQSTKENEDYDKAITQIHPFIKGTVPYRLLSSEKPFIMDIQEEYEKDKADYMRYAFEFGMTQGIVSRLVYSGKVIGILGMLTKVNRYTEADIDVLHSLGNLLAIALYNISANEEIQRKENQKSHLLQISRHIATVREKEDLFRLIAVEMKSFIDFDDVVIALIDQEKQAYTVFLSDVTGTTGKHKDFKQANQQVFDIRNNSIAKKLLQSNQPVLIDIEKEHFKDPEIDSLRFAYNFGMREEIVVKLTYSDKVIGIMGILSKKRHRYTRSDLETAQSLSSLVAIALNNVLANEELKRREQQKSQLLNISTHISTIRDKNDLFHLLTEEVRSFIDFDDAIISVIDEKMENFRLFVSDITRETGNHRDFDKVKNKVFPLMKGGIADQVIRTDKPLIIDIKKEMFRHPELDFLKHSYDFGFREEILIRLVHSGKVIGVFVLFSRTLDRFTEKDAATLQSLSSLVAVALNNILANQEIENLSKQLEQDNLYLNEEIKSNYNFEEIIGESAAIQEIFKKVVQVAYVDSTVLVLGETGTGKELIARAIHNLSARKNRPLIKVNCAALPAQLIESELFGHEKGSFTGATDKRTGKFELANGSTIFLDEIGELPLELQAKLLRALQEKEIERVGGDKSIKVDVRIIAATNRNLEKEVAENRFRSDLYYRLNIYPIELPALRDRKEDIPLLAAFFLQKLSNKLGKKITSIAPNVMEELLSNDWPGNIRELEHTIERSMLLTTGKTITNLNLSKSVIIESAPSKNIFQPKKLADNEKDLILNTLKYTKGKIRGKNGAAEILDILPTTLEARMKKLGIRKEFLTE